VVFREGHIGQVYAERGFGKTWFLQSLALAASAGAEALGFQTPDPVRVLYVDGEMASEEIKDRFALLSERLSIPQDTSMLTVLAADWQEHFLPRLDTADGQQAIEPFIEPADLVVLDNRSCLFDAEGEKDPTAWQAAQDWLLSLRRRGKAVLIAHHSNRQGGARGHSKAEDAMNLLVKLSRPEDYSQDQGARFLATFDKCRGAYGSAVAPFSAQLTVDGWHCASVLQSSRNTTADKLCEYVRLKDKASDPVKSANAAIRGAKVNRNAGLAAWTTLLGSASILERTDGTFHAK
jgi:putative DNA primase/helicase